MKKTLCFKTPHMEEAGSAKQRIHVRLLVLQMS